MKTMHVEQNEDRSLWCYPPRELEVGDTYSLGPFDVKVSLQGNVGESTTHAVPCTLEVRFVEPGRVEVNVAKREIADGRQ